MAELTLLFPAYNESENLKRFPQEVFEALHTLPFGVKVLVVNDGSTDDTMAVLSSLRRVFSNLEVVHHDRNKGLGAAVRTGIAAAKTELLLTMDTDLTFDPKFIASLLDRWEKGDVDVVSGSPKLATWGEDIPLYRRAVSQASTLVYSGLFGRRLTAFTPIMRLYRTADLQSLELESEGFQINVEILFKLVQQGKRVAEVPVPLTQRIHGESKLDYKRELLNHGKLVSRICEWRLRSLTSKAPAGRVRA